ncbi:MAG: RNA methyltransferase [Hyphomicrobiales bacterium]|nr:RNA methyltransferase [Hyphomicrobiales bacterium]
MRGYFGIGVEGISKPMNLGNLMRSAHAFGASFFFTVEAERTLARPPSDTSGSAKQIPYYDWRSISEMQLPRGCRLVGIELTDEAIELPSFRHPNQAAYILGPERSSLSADMTARCEFVVKIPTAFCINLATAGAIVMYDRVRSLGRFAPRPVMAGGPAEDLPPHRHGGIFSRRKAKS